MDQHADGKRHSALFLDLKKSLEADENETDRHGDPSNHSVLTTSIETARGSVTEPLAIANRTSAFELAHIFHCVKHNLSYNSSDCLLKLQQAMLSEPSLGDTPYFSKIACGRTKIEKVVENVLGPRILQKVIDRLNRPIDEIFDNITNQYRFQLILYTQVLFDLKQPSTYFSIETDSSSKRAKPYFPLTVRFYDKLKGKGNLLIRLI